MTTFHAPARTITAACPAESPARPAARPSTAPSIHLRAVVTWLAVYSMIMATQILLGPVLVSLSLPVRTLAVTGIVVPTVVYALVPAILRARKTLLHRAPKALARTPHLLRVIFGQGGARDRSG